jgi:streptogramin lyase
MARLRRVIFALLAVVLMMAGAQLASADAPTGVLSTFPVTGGKPFRVCVESSQSIWFTLPAQNALGHLTLSGPNSGAQALITVPTPNSQPYDIACAGGLVWLTETSGNKIASYNPSTSAWTEYPVPTQGSEPTGLDVQSGAPTAVWFVERVGNKVGKLSVPQQGNHTFTEYPAPINGMQFEDVDIASPGVVWFTAPGTRQIGRFNSSLWPATGAYGFEYTGAASQPWNIAVGDGGYPWFTDRSGNRIGQFYPGTLSNLYWYPLPAAGSQPYAIETLAGKVWFTEFGRQRTGQLEPAATAVRELLVSGAAFTSLAFDSNGCGWLADNAQNRIVRWCSPYFRLIYLPRIIR